MGWDSSENWQKKSDVVAELLKDFSKNYNILKSKSTSQALYVAVENKETQQRDIVIALIERRGAKDSRFKFYVKTLSEGAGPLTDDCPIEFFELVPKPSEFGAYTWAQDWRLRCIAKANAPKPPKLGDITGKRVTLHNNTYVVIGLQNERWIVQNELTGVKYRMSKRQEKLVEVLHE